MYRNTRNSLILLFGITVLGACGFASGGAKAGDVAEAFYSSQNETVVKIPYELFSDGQAAMQAEDLVQRRTKALGEYRNSRRIGSNRRVSLDGRNRKESITYVYEVRCAAGNTRETLMISRNSSNEPYLISAYIIEDIPQYRDPAPHGTSST